MSAWSERAGERLNPIVVQELRRGLRSKLFSASFVLLLVACVVVALAAYGIRVSEGPRGVGKGAFIALYACLAAVSYFILPFTAYRSLVREREDHTWPLLVLTRMGPRQILTGKIGSTLAQALLYGSAVAPFLLFSYLLQGVGLVTVGLIIALSILAQVFVTVAAVTAATLAESRFWRGVMHFVVLVALLQATWMSVLAAGGLVSEFRGDEELLAVMGFAAWLMVAYGAILFAVAIGRLTFESGNRVFWPRLALVLHLAGTVAVCVLFARLARPYIHAADVVAFPLGLVGLLHALVAGFFLTTGPAGMPRPLRGRRWVPLLSLLRPGAASGFRTFLLLVVGFVGGALLAIEKKLPEDFVSGLSASAAFAVLYLSVSLALVRGPLARLLPTAVYQRVFVLALFVVGMGGPPLLAVMLGQDSDEEVFNALNPVFAIERLAKNPEGLWVLGPLAVAAAVVAHQVLRARDREANRV